VRSDQQQSRIFNITAETGDIAMAGMALANGQTTGDNQINTLPGTINSNFQRRGAEDAEVRREYRSFHIDAIPSYPCAPGTTVDTVTVSGKLG